MASKQSLFWPFYIILFFFTSQWDKQKTSLQLLLDWQGNFRCSTERLSAAFSLCRNVWAQIYCIYTYTCTHTYMFSNPYNFCLSSILQTGSNATFQSQLHLMDGLDIQPIQSIQPLQLSMRIGLELRRNSAHFLGTLYRVWLPKRAMFASIKIPQS